MDPYADPNALPAPRRGMGCFAKGCLTLLAVGVLLVAVAIFAGYQAYRSISGYIADHPSNVQVYPATDAQYSAVLQKLVPFEDAMQNRRRATVELTGEDLSVLIARDPRFARLRGNTALALANDEIVADVSIPLDREIGNSIPPKYFFNGRLNVAVVIDNGEVEILLHRASVNGKPLPGWVMQAMRSKEFKKELNRSFNDGFSRDPQVRDFLSRLRSARVVGDKLVLTSVGEAAVAAPPAAP